LRINQQSSLANCSDFPQIRANFGDLTVKIQIIPLSPNRESNKKRVAEIIFAPLNSIVQQIPHRQIMLIHSSNPGFAVVNIGVRSSASLSQVALAVVALRP
jgi:hypothetical protein